MTDNKKVQDTVNTLIGQLENTEVKEELQTKQVDVFTGLRDTLAGFIVGRFNKLQEEETFEQKIINALALKIEGGDGSPARVIAIDKQ